MFSSLINKKYNVLIILRDASLYNRLSKKLITNDLNIILGAAIKHKSALIIDTLLNLLVNIVTNPDNPIAISNLSIKDSFLDQLSALVFSDDVKLKFSSKLKSLEIVKEIIIKTKGEIHESIFTFCCRAANEFGFYEQICTGLGIIAIEVLVVCDFCLQKLNCMPWLATILSYGVSYYSRTEPFVRLLNSLSMVIGLRRNSLLAEIVLESTIDALFRINDNELVQVLLMTLGNLADEEILNTKNFMSYERLWQLLEKMTEKCDLKVII